VKEHLKGLAWFVGYLLVTKIVVKPIAVQLNLPYLKDL
jgi:hypothetical protein